MHTSIFMIFKRNNCAGFIRQVPILTNLLHTYLEISFVYFLKCLIMSSQQFQLLIGRRLFLGYVRTNPNKVGTAKHTGKIFKPVRAISNSLSIN